jgi:S-DNA-T family DNA segregation ATPase FtsK/SpoIIIE
MRAGHTAALALADTDSGLHGFLRRQFGRAAGLALVAGTASGLASLGTWSVADPSFSHATPNPVTNAMGYPGAVFSDLAMQFFGLASVAALVPALFWGLFLASGRGVDRLPKRGLAWLAASILLAAVIACIPIPVTWPLPSGLGGVFGDMILAVPSLVIGSYPSGWLAGAFGALLTAPAGWLFFFGAGVLDRRKIAAPKRIAKAVPEDDEEDDLEEEDDEEGLLALGALAHWWLSACAFLRRWTGGLRRRRVEDDEFALAGRPGEEAPDIEPEPRLHGAGGKRIEPAFSSLDGQREPTFDDDAFDDDDFARPSHRGPTQVRQFRSQPGARIDGPAPRPVPSARVQHEAQSGGSSDFEMPSLHFLAEPKHAARDASLSKEALEQNARLLEGVLEDFGVKGEIIHVRPGPVVTLYELEPAPGIKSSRVIGLADDIARSMSAIACRVAVVPGRNAIGIELPNATRETVYLRELLASRDFETSKAKLALALGKTINGEAVVADIAKMPHLLVAGTTGSGKSVAINTMILSILYRMTPQECRLIMIDPKMLELSVYDGIPHLLTPVVTDPKKAVVALKWTVREMEDRYRKMSKVGVRNIEGFNQRVAQADKKGEKLSRTVQTGFDRETGEAIYETENLDLEPMPFIVVIIDEMADLMMVAGKDIEGAVQRLAQMARAAGIHVIMATQRPSVDVITGTIKANFPTRISFQVTSKIDSRTILGEQGAEQLLGMGDMLYMAGGGRIQRVHGPFVSDGEVEKIVAHLKLQGVPEYLDAITEDEGEDGGESFSGGSGGGGGGGNFDDSDDPYDQAVAVVLRDGKASTSYIQRRLGIGYNRAASIIEKMEKEGIVGPANHAGKREILVPTEEDTF